MRAYRQCPAPTDFFWAKVDRLGPVPESRPDLGSCWIWTAGTRNGYGKVGLRNNTGPWGTYDAHRVSYEASRGSIPPGMQIDHLCRVPACVNPGHLEAVPQGTNIARGKKRDLYTHCPEGHEMTEDNTYRIPSTGGRMCQKCRRARRPAEKQRARERRELGLGPGEPGHRKRAASS
jgi:hypothetical protein